MKIILLLEILKILSTLLLGSFIKTDYTPGNKMAVHFAFSANESSIIYPPWIQGQ